MMTAIKSFFGFQALRPTTEFSEFFTSASSGEKKKLFKEVIRRANQDQRDLVKKYEELSRRG